MKNIRTKERDRRPKVLENASRMPKELVREALLTAKEKSLQGSKLSEAGERMDSPTSYASGRMESGIKKGAGAASHAAVKASYAAGKQAAQKTYRALHKNGVNDVGQMGQNITEKKKDMPGQDPEPARETAERGGIREKDQQQAAKKQAGKKEAIKVQEKRELSVPGRDGVGRMHRERGGASRQTIRKQEVPQKIKIRFAKRIPVKRSLRFRNPSVLPGHQEYKIQALKKSRTAKAAEQTAVGGMQQTARRAGQAASKMVGFKRAAEAAARAVRSSAAALAAGAGSMFLVLILIAGIIGGVFSSSFQQGGASLSEQVLAYTASIQKYASEYGIPDYVPVIQAIMMQESGGAGTDPMQASECPYNTKYSHSSGAITDPEYSIQVGIQYYAGCVRAAGCENPQDMERLKLSLQGYNYGNGYIAWAVNNYGGYSEANALLFSQQQAASHGWERYGDPEYVPHVLRYYSGRTPFAALFGNEQIVSVALTQLGNKGGEKFWSWYGFNKHVSWCACFVSWCADQSGLIQSGTVPMFSLCTEGVKWFQGQGKWQAPGSMPTPGTLIFFDWDHDGASDHVGIVERCGEGKIYTVEGNSGNAVRQRNYNINYSYILGYGVLVP